jgi:hypothetical protein
VCGAVISYQLSVIGNIKSEIENSDLSAHFKF